MLRNIGDPRAVGLHALADEFLRAGVESAREVGHGGGEEQGAVLQDPAAVDTDRIARELPAADDQVVAPFERGFHPERAQSRDDRSGEAPEHGRGVLPLHLPVDEGIIDIAQVVEHRASASETADYRYAACPDIFRVDLSGGILVAADDDRRDISPEAEYRFGESCQEVFLGGEVPVGVGGGVYDAEHVAVGAMNIFWKSGTIPIGRGCRPQRRPALRRGRRRLRP